MRNRPRRARPRTTTVRPVAALASARRATRTRTDPIDRDLVPDAPGPGPAAAVETVPAAATARRGGRPEAAIIDEARRTGREVPGRAGSVPAAGRAAMQTDRPTGGFRMIAPNRAGGSSATGQARPDGRTAMIASPSRAVGRAGHRSTAQNRPPFDRQDRPPFNRASGPRHAGPRPAGPRPPFVAPRPPYPGPRPPYEAPRPGPGPRPPWAGPPGRQADPPQFRDRRPPPPTDDLLDQGEELVAGRRPVEEAFVARRPAIRLLVVPQRRQALERLVLHATSLRIPIIEVEGGTLTAVAGFDGHQGIALVVGPRRFASLDEILARSIERTEPPFVLALDSLEDPQNVGTLLRSAEAAGVHGVIFPTSSAPLSPSAVKASAGGVEHLLLCPVDDLRAPSICDSAACG